MTKKLVPLALITLFHPERWLFGSEGTLADLIPLPHSERTREHLEESRSSMAKDQGLTLWSGLFHEGNILNAGESLDWLRYTWLDSHTLLPALRSLGPRLVRTEEGTRTQASWRLEYRPDWAGKPTLDEALRSSIVKRVEEAKRISVRQVWINPFVSNTYDIPGLVLERVQPVANIVLGPGQRNDARRAELEVKRQESVWWLIYDDRKTRDK